MSETQFAVLLVVAIVHVAVGFLIFGSICVVGNHLKAWLDYAKEERQRR